jgi:ABC-type lipoprotein export system ATPase subunit/ABC-type antimicrobial peptide transport system permease subunit
MELIRLENITKTYHLGEIDVPVLKGISLSIHRGEMVALMGASGSGKTTLMNILGCLDRPSSGQFWLDGQEMSLLTPNQRALVRTAKLGFVFQSFNLLPRTSATQNVIMPLSYAPRHPSTAESYERAQLLLEQVGLAERTDHEPSQMSGGQQQRVAIARALVNRPSLVLADEPTGNLDSHTSVEILRMFQQLNAEGITVILVTHDPKVAAYAHRTIRITDGLIEGDESHAPSDDGRAPRDPRSLAIPLSDNGKPAMAPQDTIPQSLAAPHARSFGRAALPKGTSEAILTATVVGEDAPSSPHVVEAEAVAPVPVMERVAPKPWSPEPSALLPPTLRTAMGALKRDKMRSALTALGVIIGVGAVIAMTEIGQGSKTAIQATIGSMGANNIIIHPAAVATGGVSQGAGSVQSLTPIDTEEILNQCPAVSDVAPIVRARVQVVYSGRNWVPNTIIGTTPSYLAVRDWESLSEGDVFTDHDVRNGGKVCLIGETLKRELFHNESPLGEEIRIQNVSFRVVGVLARKGANMMGTDQDDIVVAPWTTIKFRVNGTFSGTTQAAASAAGTANQVNSLSNLYPGAKSLYSAPSAAQAANTPQLMRLANIEQILAKAARPEQIPQAIDQITGLLRERHRLPDERDDDFQIHDMAEITKTLSSTSDLMGTLLLVVATISLIVGGVGIMNIMLVSVTERTREIGLRMAVGARSYHILRQFLLEAVLLCLVGGAIGIALGRGASILVRSVQHWPTQVSLPAIVVAVLVSAGVGIVFGFYPAWKASRLDPIEALRYE